MWQDLVYGLRQWRRSPGFALAAVGVLALGMGVGTAMYSVLYAVLLRPLPYGHPEELYKLELPRGNGNVEGNPSWPQVAAWQQRAPQLELAYEESKMSSLRLPDRTEMLNLDRVSANLFSTLQVRPSQGRGFSRQDFTPGSRVTVLTDALWERDFHRQAQVVGKTIAINGDAYTVIGILPPGVAFPLGDATAYAPFVPSAEEQDWQKAPESLTVIARLALGAAGAAQAQLNAIEQGLAREHADQELPRRVVARRYHAELVGNLRPTLEALAAAVGLVWLIACLSVAGLLLTRFAGRRRELAVRRALGAGRARLLRQLLGECLLLALAAGLAGWGLAAGAIALLGHFLQQRLPFGLNSIPWAGGALWGLGGLTLASVLLAGLMPAWLMAGTPALVGLRDGAAALSTRRQSRLRDGLVVAEIALALLLLAGAGLLLRTLQALRQVPLGFQSENVITTSLLMPPGSFAHRDAVAGFDDPLLERVRALPGVEAAALTSVIPLERGFSMNGQFEYVGRPKPPLDQRPQGALRFTTAGYPRVFGIPLERGRFFDPSRDTPHSPTVVVVNHAFAARYFPGQDAVGQQLQIGKHEYATIIGVLADVHGQAIAAPPAPEMHFAISQLSPQSGFYSLVTTFTDLAVRTRTPAAAAIPGLRRVLHQLAPDAQTDFTTMRQVVDDSIGDQIFAARLLSLFAAAALAIALAGLYGLLGYAVTQRTREMGIRMALGAQPRQILRLVLGRAAWLLGLGMGLGLGGALWLSRLLTAYLFGVGPRDPLALAGVALLLAGCGLWAAWLPARRAARIPPAAALRAE